MDTPACREVHACRVCGGHLAEVISLGSQHLGGQFPGPDEPDPPAFPLVLGRCTGECGLVQLRHTVNPELLFRKYGYRSGVTETMRKHLVGMARESVETLGRQPEAILDVGGNDGTLASSFGDRATVVDPSDVPCVVLASVGAGKSTDPISQAFYQRIRAFYPCPDVAGQTFDLIFTVACFYDADNPVRFAEAIHDNLSPDGLWCVEVANWWEALATGVYDGICHEHLTYFDPITIRKTIDRAGLRVVESSYNRCNGGSLRLYACRKESGFPVWTETSPLPDWQGLIYEDFANTVRESAVKIREHLEEARRWGERVHLLGASTKANTWLQYAGITPTLVEAASDRDPRKVGKVTPGSRIPILSEEASRALRPTVYLCPLYHFRDEVVAREKKFLEWGGKLVFPLPFMEVVADEALDREW